MVEMLRFLVVKELTPLVGMSSSQAVWVPLLVAPSIYQVEVALLVVAVLSFEVPMLILLVEAVAWCSVVVPQQCSGRVMFK